MSTVNATAPAATKKKAASPTAAAAAHPKYSDMVQQALVALKERGGSSRQAVLKYILANFKVSGEENMINAHLKTALKAGVKNGTLKQSKGTGATGSFRIGEKVKTAAKKTKSTPAAKPKTAGASKTKVVKKAPAAAKKAPASGETKTAAPKTKKVTKAPPAVKKTKKPASEPAGKKKVTAAATKKPAAPKPSTTTAKKMKSAVKKSPVKKATAKKAVVAKPPKVKA